MIYKHICVRYVPEAQIFALRPRALHKFRFGSILEPGDMQAWCPKCNRIWFESFVFPPTDFWSGPGRITSKCPACGPGRLNVEHHRDLVQSLPRKLYIDELRSITTNHIAYLEQYN